MARLIILISILFFSAQLRAQFTYFNQITGEQGDLSAEITTNVEIINNRYILLGAAVDDGTLFLYAREYNNIGEIVNSNIIYPDSSEYVYIGRTKSFQWNPYTETFVFMQGVNLLGQGNLEGYLIEFDSNLDTTFTRRYNQFTPYTYLFTFLIEEDGYVVVGETTDNPNSQGTFIMKLDFEGYVLWSEIMQPMVFQDIYRNWSIEKLENGYLIAGRGRTEESNFETFGLLTTTNFQGETINELQVVDSTMLKSNTMSSTQLESGELLTTQVIGYELVEEFNNPNIFWTKLKIRMYDPDTGEFYNEVDFFDNYEYFQGGPNKLLATPDGGVILLGGYFGWYFDKTAWMLKLDSNLNQEWYQEYSYETCNDCENLLYDIELAPDGGYVAAGSFRNSAVDPRTSTWLLKVDACGDVEWQGCTPVGIEEKEPRVFSVYPNPSVGRFRVESDLNQSVASWAVYNLSGKKVAEGNTQNNVTLEISLNLSSGLYALELVQQNGDRENHKIQIVK